MATVREIAEIIATRWAADNTTPQESWDELVGSAMKHAQELVRAFQRYDIKVEQEQQAALAQCGQCGSEALEARLAEAQSPTSVGALRHKGNVPPGPHFGYYHAINPKPPVRDE